MDQGSALGVLEVLRPCVSEKMVVEQWRGREAKRAHKYNYLKKQCFDASL